MLYQRCFDITPRQHFHVLSIDVEFADICSYAIWVGKGIFDHLIRFLQVDKQTLHIWQFPNALIFGTVDISHLVTSIIYQDFSFGTLLYWFDENRLKLLKSKLGNFSLSRWKKVTIDDTLVDPNHNTVYMTRHMFYNISLSTSVVLDIVMEMSSFHSKQFQNNTTRKTGRFSLR